MLLASPAILSYSDALMESGHALTQDQIDYFDAFGFLRLRGLFDEAAIGPVVAAADALWKEDFGGEPDPAATLMQDRFVERSAVLLSLIDDARLYDKLAQLLGERFVFCGSEGNHGVAGSPSAHHWHADRPGAVELGYLRIKVMLYLSPMTQDNGALRVIPGSHRAPFHQALLPFNQRHVEPDPIFFGEHGSRIPAHVIETDPGDAVLFSQTLFHAVYFKVRPVRRYIALKYASWPKSYAQFATLQRWSSGAFDPAPQLRSCRRPRVRAMVEPILAAAQTVADWPADVPWETS